MYKKKTYEEWQDELRETLDINLFTKIKQGILLTFVITGIFSIVAIGNIFLLKRGVHLFFISLIASWLGFFIAMIAVKMIEDMNKEIKEAAWKSPEYLKDLSEQVEEQLYFIDE